VGIIISGFIIFYVATQKYWVDIFGRLGPSENYAVFGLAVFGWGVHKIYNSDKLIGWWWLFGGTVICVGSKENFIFLILPLMYMLWSFYRSGKLNLAKISLVIGAIGWVLWIGYMVFLSTKLSGGDVYGNAVGLKSRLLVLLGMFERADVIALMVVCIGLLGLEFFMFGRKTPLLAKSNEFTVAIILLALIYTSQIFFYNGEWPMRGRYDFPGMLVLCLTIVGLVVYFHDRIALAWFRTGLILAATSGVILLSIRQLESISLIRDAAGHNVEKTMAFSMEVEQLATLGKQYPDHVFIIQTGHPSINYEAVFSYRRFLKYYGAENSFSLLWVGGKPDGYKGLNVLLARDLQNLSYFGASPVQVAGSPGSFTSYSEVDGSDTKCILLILSGEPRRNCEMNVHAILP
jgi:hypothetical protein